MCNFLYFFTPEIVLFGTAPSSPVHISSYEGSIDSQPPSIPEKVPGNFLGLFHGSLKVCVKLDGMVLPLGLLYCGQLITACIQMHGHFLSAF